MAESQDISFLLIREAVAIQMDSQKGNKSFFINREITYKLKANNSLSFERKFRTSKGRNQVHSDVEVLETI